jgi:hypothetical protein
MLYYYVDLDVVDTCFSAGFAKMREITALQSQVHSYEPFTASIIYTVPIVSADNSTAWWVRW